MHYSEGDISLQDLSADRKAKGFDRSSRYAVQKKKEVNDRKTISAVECKFLSQFGVKFSLGCLG